MSLHHPIQFGSSRALLHQFLDTGNFSQVIGFFDHNTEKHCLPILGEDTFSFTHSMSPGEEHKIMASCQDFWSTLIPNNIDRHALLVNVGGGVVTDLGGFSASCYKRGVRFLNVPTSLLAMVDASVGGKTGIDFQNVKNSIGTFANPELVIIDGDFLKTLPERQIKNGIAEMLKHAFIADKNQLQAIHTAYQSKDWLPSIEQSVAIKQRIVDADPYEKGLRKILNFGHTIGHAIESYSLQFDENPLLHGEAIAIGMKAEAQISISYCGLSSEDYNQVCQQIETYFDSRKYPESIIDSLLDLMKKDKKNQNNQIQMSLLSKLGQAEFGIAVDETHIRKSLEVLFS